MKIQGLVPLLAAFVIMGMLAFLGINWMSTIDAPTNTTSDEYKQYTNLTDTVEIGNTANEGVLILVIVAIVFAAIAVLVSLVLKR